jgi:hypothetical protein
MFRSSKDQHGAAACDAYAVSCTAAHVITMRCMAVSMPGIVADGLKSSGRAGTGSGAAAASSSIHATRCSHASAMSSVHTAQKRAAPALTTRVSAARRQSNTKCELQKRLAFGSRQELGQRRRLELRQGAEDTHVEVAS